MNINVTSIRLIDFKTLSFTVKTLKPNPNLNLLTLVDAHFNCVNCLASTTSTTAVTTFHSLSSTVTADRLAADRRRGKLRTFTVTWCARRPIATQFALRVRILPVRSSQFADYQHPAEHCTARNVSKVARTLRVII